MYGECYHFPQGEAGGKNEELFLLSLPFFGFSLKNLDRIKKTATIKLNPTPIKMMGRVIPSSELPLSETPFSSMFEDDMYNRI
jgi:hypothetical protein